MLDITSEQKNILKKYVADVDELIENDDIERLLIDFDDAIIEFGMDSKQEITSEGIKLQKIYDQIYNQNC